MSKDVTIYQYPKASVAIPYRVFDKMFDSAYIAGYPQAWSWYGINRSTETYSTGTVATTADSRTLTGTDTSWLGNVQEGSAITIGTDTYHVDTVDSDTQITMVQHASRDVTGADYSIKAKDRSQIIFSSAPSAPVNVFVSYPKRVYPLVNDNDEPEIYEEYVIALENMLYAYVQEKLTSNKSISWLTVAENQVNETWKNVQEGSPVEQAMTLKRGTASGYRRTLYG